MYILAVSTLLFIIHTTICLLSLQAIWHSQVTDDLLPNPMVIWIDAIFVFPLQNSFELVDQIWGWALLQREDLNWVRSVRACPWRWDSVRPTQGTWQLYWQKEWSGYLGEKHVNHLTSQWQTGEKSQWNRKMMWEKELSQYRREKIVWKEVKVGGFPKSTTQYLLVPTSLLLIFLLPQFLYSRLNDSCGLWVLRLKNNWKCELIWVSFFCTV